MQFSSYFNAALERKQNISVTQVNPATPKIQPEGLFDLKETSGLREPFDLCLKSIWTPRIELV